ncbi:MAG: hypothetical protein ACR2P7_09930, partial [bacterium]
RNPRPTAEVNMKRNTRNPNTRFALVVLFALALAGCGGGGGGGGGGSSASAIEPYRQAAQHRPVAGSVTQGSRATFGVTNTGVSMSCPSETVCALEIDVNQDIAPLEIDLRDTTPTNDFFDLPDDPVGRNFMLIEAELTPPEAVSDEGGFGELEPASSESARARFVTDIDPSADDGGEDYLAFGFWEYRTDAADPSSYGVGVFADGNEFIDRPGGGALPTDGSASYVGKTFGAYDRTDAGNEERGFLIGDVALTADFGDGTISGAVSNILLEDEDGDFAEDAMTDIALAAAAIDDGFFEGVTSATVELGENPGDNTQTGVGRWGGQFFGGEQDDGSPSRVGGTWGIATDDLTAIGAYGAWPDEDE